MAGTIFGYEIASPEKQRKTALVILGFVVAIVIGGVGAMLFVSSAQHAGREQAIATITAFQSKCRYVVRNVSKRVSYYDHTGLIACDSAHRIARVNNNPLGSVRRETVAAIDFATKDGKRIRSHVTLSGPDKVRIGQQAEVLYSIENPGDVREFVEIPFGLGKQSIAPVAGTEPGQVEAAAPDAGSERGQAEPAAPARPRASEQVSESTRMWIGLIAIILMGLIAFWLIRKLVRLVKSLIVGPQSPPTRATSDILHQRAGNASDRRPGSTRRGQFGARTNRS